jgi:hypothetical protein
MNFYWFHCRVFNNTNGGPGIDHRPYHSYSGDNYFDDRSLRWDFKRIYCRDWPMVPALSFSVRLPFFLVDNPAVDGPLYHNDNNGRLGGATDR